MHDDAISQAEIDALVRGLADGKEATAEAGGQAGGTALLSGLLADLLKEAGGALAELAGVSCQGSMVALRKMTAEEAGALLTGPVLMGRADLQGGLSAPVCFMVPEETGLAIMTQIYGGVAPSELDEAALGALADGLSLMLQGGAEHLTRTGGVRVRAGAVTVHHGGTPAATLEVEPATPVYVAELDLTLGEERGGRLYYVMTEAGAASLIKALQGKQAPPTGESASGKPGGAPKDSGPSGAAEQVAAATAAPAGAQPAPFPDLKPKPAREEPRNIDLLLDVTLQVTVELGRTRRQIREVLSLGPGSVVELDRLAGEPVDVLINGKLIAKGEVVVIDENYGVRITDIISPTERVQSLR